MASKFVPVTGLEQAVALREAGLLYFLKNRGNWVSLTESSQFPVVCKSLGDTWITGRYYYLVEE